MTTSNKIKYSYTKIITIVLIALLSMFSGYKVYNFLDFTLGNLLQGMYSSYTMTETGINKIKEVNSNIKNKVKGIISKVQDEQEQIAIANEIKLREAELEQKKEIRQDEIKRTRLLIDMIPILLAIIFTWKMFSFIINLIIDESSVIVKIKKWIKDNKEDLE